MVVQVYRLKTYHSCSTSTHCIYTIKVASCGRGEGGGGSELNHFAAIKSQTVILKLIYVSFTICIPTLEGEKLCNPPPPKPVHSTSSTFRDSNDWLVKLS